jgi:nicotinamide-nucleotide amidase
MKTDIDKLSHLLVEKKLTIAVAESCSGGNLSALLTSVSGASAYFECGFITYSNQAKMTMLGVKSATLDEFGAVSQQVAVAMARGVIEHSSADISVSITGIAGPTGGTLEKPVGTVCFGFCVVDNCTTISQHFKGNRVQIVQSSVDFAVKSLLEKLNY